MWTTREWYACLARTAAYERRECKRSQGTKYGGSMARKEESDAENSGLEQWLQRTALRGERTLRQIWFWSNHD